MAESNITPIVRIREEIQQAPSSKLVLDKSFVRKQPVVTTLDFTNVEYVRLDNTGAVTVTGAKGGQDGQTVRILGDGQTTISHNAAVTKPAEPFLTNTGANKLLSANKVYRFNRFLNAGDPQNGKWIEDA